MFLCMAAVRPPGVVGLSQPQFVPPLACLNVTFSALALLLMILFFFASLTLTFLGCIV